MNKGIHKNQKGLLWILIIRRYLKKTNIYLIQYNDALTVEFVIFIRSAL